MRYLIDTCVLLSALRSKRGASHQLLRKVLLGQLPIVLHFKLLAEYQAVLSRPKNLRATGYQPEEIERLLAALVTLAEPISVRYLWRPNLRDEGDNFIVEIAVAAQPCTIVTHNIKDFLRGELRFPGVLVKRPQEVSREQNH